MWAAMTTGMTTTRKVVTSPASPATTILSPRLDRDPIKPTMLQRSTHLLKIPALAVNLLLRADGFDIVRYSTGMTDIADGLLGLISATCRNDDEHSRMGVSRHTPACGILSNVREGNVHLSSFRVHLCLSNGSICQNVHESEILMIICHLFLFFCICVCRNTHSLTHPLCVWPMTEASFLCHECRQ